MADSNDTSNKSVAKNKHRKDELEQKAGFLRGVAGKAYICQMKELDRAALEHLCFELTSYLKKCVSNISTEKILSAEFSPYFAGIREAVELRNYLSMFVESQKKKYQNGYIYIMPI